MSHNNVDDESDYSDEDVIDNNAPKAPISPVNEQNNPKISPKNYKHVTTEGTTSNLSCDPKLGVMECDMCGKYFTPDMLVMIDPLQCKHCFFFMNYGNKDMINGQYGTSVYEYISQCEKDHPTPCIRLADGSCNCYICASKMGFPLDGVVDTHTIQKNHQESNRDENPSDCSVDDVGDDIMERGDKVVVYL